MKNWIRSYRICSVWTSLFILGMFFGATSDGGRREPFMLLAFMAGAFLFGVGAVKEWNMGHRALGYLEALLAVCSWIAFLLLMLRIGEII